MQTVADLVADARETEGIFATGVARAAPYSYHDFATNAWKAGNLLRHYGVRHGERAAVVIGSKEPGPDDEPGWLGDSPAPLVALLGAALDGAVLDLDPPGAVDATVLVGPAAWMDRYERGPGTKGVAYGGPPDDPRLAHFERETWSENPLAPPGDLGPEDDLLAADRVYSQGELLAASGRVVAEGDLTGDDEVVVRAPVSTPGTLAAVFGVIRAGATLLVGDGAAGDVGVVAGPDPESAPEARTIDAAEVF